MRSLCLFTGLAVASILPAQVVHPSNFARAEGNHVMRDGIGDTGLVGRHLQLHSIGAARTINGFALRRDGLSYSAGTYPSSGLVCDVFVSTAASQVGSPDPNFEMNHGTDKTQVAAGQLFQFPTSVPGSMPYPFDFKFPFSQPFMFTGSGDFCWDVQIQIRTNTQAIELDATANWTPDWAVEVYQGTGGCTGTGQGGPMTLMAMTSSNTSAKTFSINWVGSNLPANSSVVMMIGDDDISLGGVPLPFTLPGTSSAPSGPCTIYNNALMMVPVPTDPNGGINITANGFTLPGLHGVGFFNQVIAADAAANSWGVVLSNTVQAHFVKPFSTVDVGHVFSNSTMGPTGMSFAYQGAIAQFN